MAFLNTQSLLCVCRQKEVRELTVSHGYLGYSEYAATAVVDTTQVFGSLS